jgi:DNA segregation ATPase FtsK/SpoIIIE-like protein
MIDGQGVTFTPFVDDVRLLYPIVSKPEGILEVLILLVAEMKRREELLGQWKGVKDVNEYNRLPDVERLPIIPILMDEISLFCNNKEITSQITILGRAARKTGLPIIAMAQQWRWDAVSTAFRANLSTAINFRAQSKRDSHLLLDDSVAASITRKGQAYCRLPGIAGLVELQAPNPGDLLDIQPARIGPSNKETKIIELHQAGASHAQICQEVYGYKSSNKYPEIDEVIGKYGNY